MNTLADIENWQNASFEQKYKSMMGGMSEDQIRKSAEQVLHMCQCVKCPSYTEGSDDNLVFCTLGKSDTMHEKKGCLCSTCAVAKTMSLRWEYYCIQGSAVSLSDLSE